MNDLILSDFEQSRFGTRKYSSPAEQQEIYEIQQGAREILEMNRRMMPEPRQETPLQYRKRICDTLKANTALRHRDIRREPPEVFAATEARIYREAAQNYLHPHDVAPGEVVEVKRTDASGRKISEFAVGRGGSAFRDLYGAFLATPLESPVHIDGKAQPLPVIL